MRNSRGLSIGYMRCVLSITLFAMPAFMGLFFVPIVAFAHTDQWEWQIEGRSEVFQTREEAVDFMHGLSATYALLTEAKPVMVDEAFEKWEYTAPPKAPVAGPWAYGHSYWPPTQTYATEAEAAAVRLAQIDAANSCADWWSPNGDWVTLSSYLGLPHHQAREYKVFSEVYQFGYPPSCLPPSGSWSDGIDRNRTVACPALYSANASMPPYCFVNASARISGRPLMTCSIGAASTEVGNPCDAATGDKSQTETDWSGAGITFTRSYHSLGGDTSSGLGQGWTHNFRKIIFVNTYAYALVRGDGRVQVLKYLSSTHYIATSDGIEVKMVGSDWLAYLSDGSIEVYDASGRLVQINDHGRITTLTYTGGTLTAITGPFGHALQLEYEDGRIKRLINPAGGTIEYTYDLNNNLTQVEYPDSTTRIYHYENTSFPNHLTGITDESNIRYATFGYDSIGRATLTEHAGGANQYTLSYGSTSTTVTNAVGTVSTYQFTNDSYSRRVTGYTFGGLTRSAVVPAYSTDFQRRATQITDERGIVTTFTYDQNHLISKTDAYGTALARTTSYQYNSTNDDLPTQITEPNRVTTFIYNSLGKPLTKTITDSATSASRTWTWTYDSYGRVLTENGPRTDVSDITTYAYYNCTAGYECGQVYTIENALGHVTTYNTYNSHGQPLTITDPNGAVTTLTYDARQRLTSRAVGTETTAFVYWPNGLLKKITLPDGSYLEYGYDDAQRLVEISDSEGNYIVYTLDAMGNRTKEETFDPSNYLVRLHHRAFNTLNQLWKDIGAANTTAVTTVFGYDDNGNQTLIDAPASRDTANLYDELNRLKQITDPASGVTQFAYDANDNLTSVTDPRSKVTGYTYSGFGDLTQQTSPDTGTTTNTFDSGGNLATSTDARSKTGTHSYDALNRVTQLSYPDQTIAYTYDTGTNNKGRLMQVSDNSGSTSWAYTSLGRVASRTQSMGVNKTVSYGYNSAGQLTTLTTPSGQTLTYGYSNNRISSITLNSTTTVLDDVIYDPFGPTKGWTWGNSTLAVREYDADGNVTDIDSAGLREYDYDDAFRIAGITDTVDSNLSWTHGYDSLDRLTSASKTGQSQTWTYDANGNRLTQGGSTSSTFTISSTSNRLSGVSGALSRTYTHDAAGNVTGDGTFTFTYNDAGRMTSAADGSVTATYSINSLGQRVKKTVGSSNTYFVYDEAGHLLGEYDGSGNLVQEIVWLGDIPVASIQPNGGGVGIFYIHTDHLNTPRKLTRPTDNVIVWRWDSDPFGTDLPDQDPDGNSAFVIFNLRFPGQYYDSETGLYYNYMRDYDTAIGRYLQSDPIGLRGGVNTYAYVGNTPTMLVDPLGLFSCPGGEWKQELADSSLSLALGGYVSVGRVNYTCRSSPTTKCSATQVCIGGGPIFGAGVSWNLIGRTYGTPNSAGFRGWSGWNVTGSIGPVSASANVPGPGGSVSPGVGIGVGGAAIRCINIGLQCTDGGCK